MRNVKLVAMVWMLAAAVWLAGCPGPGTKDEGPDKAGTKETGKTTNAVPEADAAQELEMAMELIGSDDREDIQEGIAHAEKALELEPDQAKSTCALGTGHRKLGDYDKAIEYYEKAVDLDPEYWICYDNMGIAYTKIFEDEKRSEEDREQAFKDAEISFHNAIELDDTYAPAHLNLGQLYYLVSDEAAIQEYEAFLELSQDEVKNEEVRSVIEKIKADKGDD